MSQGCGSKAAITFGSLLTNTFAFLACSDQRPNKVEHVVIILKENHTFDNYFGTFPGADGTTTGLTSTGAAVPLAPMPDADDAPLCNSWDCAIEAMNGSKMNEFDLISIGLAAYTPAANSKFRTIGNTRGISSSQITNFTSVHGHRHFCPSPLFQAA